MKRHDSDRFHTFNLFNMALGALVFIAAVYLMVTGAYDKLPLDKLEIGAPLYVVMFWYLDRLFRPLWSSASTHLH